LVAAPTLVVRSGSLTGFSTARPPQPTAARARNEATVD